MYTLSDTFNERVISRHRTLQAALKARAAHAKAVRRANGTTSYVTYAISGWDGVNILKMAGETESAAGK